MLSRLYESNPRVEREEEEEEDSVAAEEAEAVAEADEFGDFFAFSSSF